MPSRLFHREWIAEQETTRYPFAETASLTNEEGDMILDGLFLDAILYPIGAGPRLYLAEVEIDHQDVTVSVGDSVSGILASGTVSHLSPPDAISLTDSLGRPAGLLVSEASRLAIFQSWSVGTHTFLPEQTEFAATVTVPSPEVGLRGILLEDGSLFTGDVWIVGSDGIVVRDTQVLADMGPCQEPVLTDVIRIDIVGDPLFRRRLCTPGNIFETPRFIRTVEFRKGAQSFTCTPDAFGNMRVLVGTHMAEDTVLRVHTTDRGLLIEAVGEKLNA